MENFYDDLIIINLYVAEFSQVDISKANDIWKRP